VEAFREADPLCARVAEQIVLAVSTRGYARSLGPAPEDATSRGTSKSAASRALIDKTTEKVTEFLDRRLEEVDLIVMFIDGIEVAKKSVIVQSQNLTQGARQTQRRKRARMNPIFLPFCALASALRLCVESGSRP
jgi:hypothetical protein